MGQYHYPVNLDKKQFIHPHKLGNGLKLWEMIAGATAGVGSALIVLLASHSNGQGGGDIETDPIVGSWRGDRIAFVGDYDDASLYQTTGSAALSGAQIMKLCDGDYTGADALWTDVSAEVCLVIERELEGEFTGDGWRSFVTAE